jgi:hypothetical protein
MRDRSSPSSCERWCVGGRVSRIASNDEAGSGSTAVKPRSKTGTANHRRVTVSKQPNELVVRRSVSGLLRSCAGFEWERSATRWNARYRESEAAGDKGHSREVDDAEGGDSEGPDVERESSWGTLRAVDGLEIASRAA